MVLMLRHIFNACQIWVVNKESSPQPTEISHQSVNEYIPNSISLRDSLELYVIGYRLKVANFAGNFVLYIDYVNFKISLLIIFWLLKSKWFNNL